MQLTRQNIVGFRAGIGPVVIYCLVCNEEKTIPQMIYATTNKKGKGVYTERNNLITEFTETHFGKCVMKPITDAAKTKEEAAKPLRANTIEIQTHRAQKNDFCFYHTLSHSIRRGADMTAPVPIEDRVTTFREDSNDRLRAAIANLGLACRVFADAGLIDGLIIIESDKDGKDTRHGGEHDILFSLLYPQSFGDNRKNAALYADYQPWLAKAKMLINDYKITVKLKEK